MKKLFRGLKTDTLPIDQETGSWSDARNIVVYKKRGAISNEDGFDDVTPFNSGGGTIDFPNKPVIGVISLEDEKVVFFGTTNPADSEIGRITANGGYLPIIIDSLLNFNQNFPIQGVFENKFNSNTIIAWTDFNDYPKILNIDCIPFQLDSNYAVIPADIEKAKTFLRLFPQYNTPIISEYNVHVRDGQGALLTGAYYPILQYELLDGTFTSWSKVYNGVSIVSSNQETPATTNTVEGNIGGESSGKSIEITMSNVDSNYKRIHMGYIYVSNGITTVYRDSSYTINGTSLTINLRGSNQTQLTLDEILTPNAIYKKAKTITSALGKLFLGNVEEEIVDLEYQQYANLINVGWVREKKISLNRTTIENHYDNGVIDNNPPYQNRGTYQSSTRVYFDKGFKSAECYALYIVFKLKNGNYSKAYHIPGRDANPGDRTDVLAASEEYGKIGPVGPKPKFRVDNTATYTTNTRGTMGFWENDSELYPEDPLVPGTVHPDFANIPGINFANRKVRHHVFPDIRNIPTPESFIYLDINLGVNGKIVSSKIFGLTISNVNIPSNILDLVDSWEIHYAERNMANIRILANDCIMKSRLHTFDLMVNKPSIYPTYLRAVYQWNITPLASVPAGQTYNFLDYPTSFNNGPLFTPNKIFRSTGFVYVGENTTIPVNNANKADSIYFNEILTAEADASIDAVGGNGYTLLDICIYKLDTYVNFQTQTLVATGFSFKITSSGIQGANDVYGGDIHTNAHYFVDATTPSPDVFAITVESISNIGLRRPDRTLSKFFAPNYPNPTPSWYGYNADYNAINRYNQISVFYPSDNCIDTNQTIFEHRIPFSITEGTENVGLNWRTFKINSYYDMPRNKGVIWNLLGSDRTLYIHHELSLFIAEVKDKLNTNGDETYLGISDIFDRPPQEVLPVTEGFAGTQSQFACILCRVGYCFIDRRAGKVFIYDTSKGLKEISDQGMYNFFSDHSETFDDDVDNPFISKGYTMAFDNEFDRLIISKTEDGDISNPANEYSTNPNLYRFCLSYYPDLNEGQGAWASFHDYNPNVMFYNRTGLFSVNNYTFKVFKHNSDSNKAIYYNGVKRNSYIDIVFNETPEQTKRFDNVNWISNVELDRVNYKDETITHLIVFNETQCSGLIVLSTEAGLWFSKDRRNAEGTWNYNNFRDLVSDITLPFLDDKNQIINSNIDPNKSWFDMSKFISKFVVFRLIYDNVSQKNIHISLVDSNIKKSDR